MLRNCLCFFRGSRNCWGIGFGWQILKDFRSQKKMMGVECGFAISFQWYVILCYFWLIELSHQLLQSEKTRFFQERNLKNGAGCKITTLRDDFPAPCSSAPGCWIWWGSPVIEQISVTLGTDSSDQDPDFFVDFSVNVKMQHFPNKQLKQQWKNRKEQIVSNWRRHLILNCDDMKLVLWLEALWVWVTGAMSAFDSQWNLRIS